jgi:membrane associated rhomboid family serine protease
MRYRYHLWRFLTPMFLHANLQHLASNLFSQLVIGSQLESSFTHWCHFPSLYLLSGFGGVLFSSLISDSPSVGASTCIFGLIAYYVRIQMFKLAIGHILRCELEYAGSTSQESNTDLLGHHFLALAVYRGNLIAFNAF